MFCQGKRVRMPSLRSILPGPFPISKVAAGEGVGEIQCHALVVGRGSLTCCLLRRWIVREAFNGCSLNSRNWSPSFRLCAPGRFVLYRTGRGKGREQEIEAWREKAKAGLSVLDRHLQNREFMLGANYGITDIALFGYVHVGRRGGIDMSLFPAICAWMARVEQTTGFVPLISCAVNATPFSVPGR